MTPSLRLRLLEALEPFVREAFRYEPPEGDDDRKAFETNLRIGQVRDLARLHDELKGGDASDTDGPTLARTGRYATPPPSASEPAGAEVLAACPFCGGRAFFLELPPEGRLPRLWRPQCSACGADTGGSSTKKEAAQTWNRRADAEGEALKLAEKLRSVAAILSAERILGWGNPLVLDIMSAVEFLNPPKGSRREEEVQLSRAIADAPAGEGASERFRPDDVEWVVNDMGELGVKIGDQFFFLYKGHSFVYGALDADPTIPPIHEKSGKAGFKADERMKWRYVGKREFGECAYPINYADPTKIGTVSLDDGNEWYDIPAAVPPPPAEKG